MLARISEIIVSAELASAHSKNIVAAELASAHPIFINMEKTYLKDVSQKVGESVTVAGWVHSRRDMGKIIFIDLRDSTGLLQVVFAPNNKEVLELANDLRPEFCVRIKGQINERPEKQRN